MIINGTNLSTVGFTPGRGRQLPRLGGERSDIFEISGAIGGVRLAGQVPHGRIVQPGWLSGTNHADLLANLDALTELLQGELIIAFDDISDREWIGAHLQDISQVRPLGADQLTERMDLVLEFALPDPTAWQSGSLMSWYNALTGQTIPLGTAPSPARVEIEFPGSAPATWTPPVTIDIGSYTMEWFPSVMTVSAGDFLLVDSSDFTVIQRKGGPGAAEHNVIDGITDQSEFPIADPADSPVGAQVSFQTGAPTSAIAGVRKRWW